ncbi:MAG TPA: chaperone modulator CbpM [Advenella sp.]|nr:chaperone modulator CbpM [Advenella sp.]
MTVQITETIWLNQDEVCSLQHVAAVSGLSEADVMDLVETGVLSPVSGQTGSGMFYSECIVVARKARRLRDDFDLNADGVALVLNLLRRVDALESELLALRPDPKRNRPAK